MKKLLAILTSVSLLFLISISPTLVNNNNNEKSSISSIFYNKSSESAEHEFQPAWGIYKKLTKIGYYRDGKHIRIKTIPPTVVEIAADLPSQITSLKNAFVGNNQNVKWTVLWNTKNIIDMSGVFFNTNYINDPSIAKWDTSNVEDMSKMFSGTKSFNQDISGWDVSKVKNMKEMFHKANAFTHNLQGWSVAANVENTNFGLQDEKQPKWINTIPDSSVQIDSKTPSSSTDEISSKTSENSTPKLRESEAIIPPTVSNNQDIPPKTTEQIKSNKPIKDSNPLKNENEVLNDNKNNGSISKAKVSKQPKTDKNFYKIPSYKPNTIISKSNSPNAGIIAGAVLGSFTIIGTGAGVGYYYRKNLKNLYLKSADKIKPSLLKSKDNIKDLYVKSKNKIKDKIAKIKSKK
ncbi:Myrrcad domain-containing protein [Mycoplasma capricolum]|uniref:Myrrcad domain-containing protein n=1 Tax=Mycoplasma capricolum TaxID=2095 RepID=UPI00062A3737|nr:Myrrcad domain-containing protein [Mycoplasma capricolum]KKW61215.1 putative variable surface protein [Mycoplasma capricolum subsp. capricolum]